MNFSCEACQHRYAVPDEKIRGRTVRIRCRHCGHLTSVKGPADEAPAPAAAPTAAQAEWYAMIRGVQAGPFDLPGLSERARLGEVSAQTFVWRPGMPEWLRAGELPELSDGLFAPPPAPAVPSAPVSAPASSPGKITAAELFSDLGREDEPELPVEEEEPLSPHATAATHAQGHPHAPDDDPFAALGDIDPAKLPPPGESTMFFIQQAGVTKRNPPWKIAAFIGAGVGSVGLVLLLLSSFDVVPLTVRTVDDSGQTVEQSVFSADGVSQLGDVLLGRGGGSGTSAAESEAKARDEAKRRSGRPAQKPSGAPGSDAAAAAVQAGPSKEDLAALYGDTARSDRGPRVRPASAESTAPQVATGGGLSAEQLAKVVAASQTAFQTCIESELRKNPNLKVPRFFIRANVANSGAVTAASIDRKDVDGSALGECLKSRARRMAFAPFEGEELVVEIPLIVGVAM